MKLKVKSIEHLKELSDVDRDGMEHFEGCIRLNGNLNSSKSIWYFKKADSWDILNESDGSEAEYDSTEEMIENEEFLIQAINEGSLWTH